MHQTLLSLLLLVCCQQSAAQTCPDGFASHHSRCLLINLTASVSWCDANRACAERGAELLTNWPAIQDLTTTIPASNQSNAWIGVSDLASERDKDNSSWQFVNRRGVMPTNTPPWIPGDPNNGGGNQDCIRLLYSYDPPKYGLIDKQCNDLSGYVCEIPDVPLTTTACGVPSGGGGGSSDAGRVRWVPAPPPTSSHTNDISMYCFWERSGVLSLHDCAMLAGFRPFSRSFLYNKDTKVCHVTEFSDSQTALEQPPTAWVKFVKG